MAIQSRYDELFKLLSGDFRRNYAPHHAFADACSMFLTLPGLVGFWPGSAMGAAGLLNDLSGNDLQMTNNGNALFSAETSSLIPWLEFDGATQYFSRPDEAVIDILGNEAYVATAVQGLTVGGWFWCDANSTQQGLITKWLTPNQWGWRLIRDSSNRASFAVSRTGSTSVGVNGGDSPLITAGAWFFVAGRWTPDAEIEVMVNNVTSLSGSTPDAPIFNSSAELVIGRHDGASYLNGRASMCFLCASAVPYVHLTTLYEWTRPLFNR